MQRPISNKRSAIFEEVNVSLMKDHKYLTIYFIAFLVRIYCHVIIFPSCKYALHFISRKQWNKMRTEEAEVKRLEVVKGILDFQQQIYYPGWKLNSVKV